MEKMTAFLRKNKYVAALIFVELVLFATNYKLGTYLVGWDNLYPELNFSENLKRNLFSVWQEYRGLGLLDGMSYAASLSHTVFIWILSLIFPISFLRYFFVFLVHFLGGLGFYFLLCKLVFKHNKDKEFISLAGSLFYMFNLTSIQMFFAPFEVFIIHFTTLPWMVLFIISYLTKPNLRNLFAIFAISLLSSAQAHVPQVFIVYFGFILLILISFTLISRLRYIKRVVVIFLLLIFTNLFWLLPYLYSVPQNAPIIIHSKINELSNENVYLKNKSKGDILDVLYLKGFMLDEVEKLESGEYDFIMRDWKNYLNNPIFIFSSTVMLILVLVGFYSSLRNNLKITAPFSVAFLLLFVLLATNGLLTGQINDLLRENSSLFKEAFRFSYTKFGILFAFLYSIFSILGVVFLISKFQKYSKKIVSTMLVIIFLYTAPAFFGNFFFDSLRLKIPDDYIYIMKYFKNLDKHSRVALLPQPSFWSWRQYDFGARGSGFLWFGIPQPTLDRAFDPWSDKNENYYWELSQAIYSQDIKSLENVFDKYQIRYLVIDEHIINPVSYKALYRLEVADLLSKSSRFKKISEMGKIKTYQFDLSVPVRDYIFIETNLKNIGPKYSWNNFDDIYNKVGNYQTNGNVDTYYPYRSLFTNKQDPELNYGIVQQDSKIIFSSLIPEAIKKYQLVIPDKAEFLWIDQQNLASRGYFSPKVTFDGNEVKTEIPITEGYFSNTIDFAAAPKIAEPKQCNQLGVITNNNKGENISNKIMEDGGIKFLRLSATNTRNCSASYFIPNLSHKFGYLVKIKSRNISGKPIYFWIENINNKKSEIEINLPKENDFSEKYVVIPPMEPDGVGYTLHFDNISVGEFESVNDIVEARVAPIPFDFLLNINLTNEKANKTETYVDDFIVFHPNPSLYLLAVADDKSLSSATLVLSQSFHKDWLAVDITNFPYKLIGDHVLVNNWENGWNLNQSGAKRILIFFWPQILGHVGQIILIILIAGFSIVGVRIGLKNLHKS